MQIPMLTEQGWLDRRRTFTDFEAGMTEWLQENGFMTHPYIQMGERERTFSVSVYDTKAEGDEWLVDVEDHESRFYLVQGYEALWAWLAQLAQLVSASVAETRMRMATEE